MNTNWLSLAKDPWIHNWQSSYVVPLQSGASADHVSTGARKKDLLPAEVPTATNSTTEKQNKTENMLSK